MPRAFSSASITCSIGGLGGFNSGTMLAIARRADDAAWHGIVTTRQSGAGAYEAYLDIAPSGHATAGAIWSSWGGTDNAATLKFLAADSWCIIACTKATGSATPRYHKCVLSSRTWTHNDGGGAVANATSTPGGTLIFGDVAGDALNGDLAAVALYARTFTDQEIESLLSWETWLSYGPAGAWLFDQAATTQSLVDWVDGANQSAITGTTVTTASLPGWNQSDGGIWVAEITATGGAVSAGAMLTATATLTAGAVLSELSAATLTGTATLTAGATLAAVSAASLTGTATLTAGAVETATAAATLTATATLTAAAARTAVAGATLTGTATLTAGAVLAAVAAATLTATATLTAGATIGTPPVVAAATLAALATLTAGAVETATAGAALAVTATFTAAVVAARVAAAVLPVVATLTAAGRLSLAPAAVLQILAVLSATADISGAFTVGALTARSAGTGMTAGSGPTTVLTAASTRGGPA